MHALISIHDVMPQTLDRVQSIMDTMTHIQPELITLLVVPGLNWHPKQTDRLRQWQESGYILAGHGWQHRTRHIRGAYHRLHSALISRQAAEHLSLTEAEISGLMRDCYDWFARQQLVLPDLYVPPAWAMGKAGRQTLARSPFRFFETTAGYFDSVSQQWVRLPLAGFEADNLFRVCSLRFWNGLNRRFSSARRPLRLSIHPYDQELPLQDSLHAMVCRVSSAVDYHALFSRD